MSEMQKPGVKPQPVTGRTRDLVIFVDKAIFQMAKHWLALINVFWGLYVGLPIMAPVMMDAGWELPAKVIYTIYLLGLPSAPHPLLFLRRAAVGLYT